MFPFGYDMENYRSGLITSAIYNVNRSKESDKLWMPDDFYKNKKQKIVPQTEDEMVNIAKNIASIFA